MDPKTISEYDDKAPEIARLHETLFPSKLYELIARYFIRGGRCADIGCGTGRDTSWLASKGYEVIGIDASRGMLGQARALHPYLDFFEDSLPFLATQGNELYENVLCSAVIMHLPNEQIESASRSLVRITQPGGVIVLSYRGTKSADHREGKKLYSAIAAEDLQQFFFHAGAPLLHSEVDHEEGRELDWVNLVFRKSPLPAA